MQLINYSDEQQKLRLYQAIIDAMPQSIFLLDRDKNIVGIFNAMPEAMAGEAPDKFMGRNLMEFVNDPLSPFHDATVRLNNVFESVFATGKQVKFQYHILDSYLEATISRIEGGHVLCQVQNITDIARQVQGVNDAVCKELSEAKERAEKADALKSAYLANISHEIRTPLNSIIGFAQLVSSAETAKERETYQKIINSNSEVLLTLINDILDLSKIEAGYIEYTNVSFDLEELLEELRLIFSNKTQSDVQLTYNKVYDHCFVVMDRSRISQLVSNFLANACKFTTHGTIELGYRVDSDGLKIFVRDTGCGISEENQRDIFTRFAKFNKNVQGTGLGMPISKGIAEAYRGSIGVSSKVGEGATFWVNFPIKPDTGQTTSQSPQPNTTTTVDTQTQAPDKSGLKILIAEDMDSNYILLKAMLREHNLTRVVNGAEAVEMVRNEHFDIVLMDIRMPVMDGHTATRTIRTFNTTIPIVAVTANAFETDRREALDAGCNDFLSKPVDRARLNEVLTKRY